MTSLSLVFDLLARDQASPAFRKVGDSAEKAGKQTSGFGSLTAGAMKTAGAAIAGLALGNLFAGFIADARESAKVSRLTAQVIETTGSAAHITAKQVGELADAISAKTGIDDEQIQSAENLLLTFTKVRNEVGRGNDVFDRATQLAVDMSVVLGTDASGAAIQLGKALNDPIKGIGALSRAGVSFTAEQKDQIRTFVEAGDVLSAQKIILEELGTEFGGAAEAASDPLQRLGTIAGNLGEDVGTLLLPVISDLADFAANDLIPAIRDAASWLGDNFGDAVSTVGSVVGDVVDIAGGLLGFFADLPGPVQLAAGAAAAWVVAGDGILRTLKPLGGLITPLRGTTQAFGEALGYARANGDGLGTVLKDVGRYAGGQALSGIKKLAHAIGPELAIGAAVFAISELVSGFQSLSSASDEAEAAAEGLAGSLTLIDKAADRRSVRTAIEDVDGLIEALEGAGVSSEDAINGLLGQADAQDRVTEALQVYLATQRTAQTGGDAADVLEAINNYDELASGYGNAASSARFFADEAPAATGAVAATGQAAADSVPQIDEATQALEDWLKQLQGIAEGFVEPLSTYQDLLSQKEQAEQESAQATADATESSKDSWEDYATDVSVSLGEYAQTLQDQLTAQENWRDNLGTIAQRAGADVAQYLTEMGADGIQIVADMATGTDAEVQAMADAIRRDIQVGGADWTAEMQRQTDFMAAVGAQGARATVAGVAAELSLGTNAVRRIAAQYGVELAGGVNPILSALGQRSVVLNGPAQLDFWEGGWTGPGAKFTPAGVVHGNEYVEPTESLAYYGRGIFEALHKRSIPREMIAGLPGYANGGFVTEADVPRPYSTSPYGPPISTAGDAAMDTEYSAVAAFVRESGPWGRGLSWARTQVGKPYIWGGVGPTGYDCSGFMSALTNVILGQSPYSRRGATANFPWPGFASGDGIFTIGSTPNAGGGIGHMAGTLLGVNVESAGGVGVRVGSSARGAHDGLFGTRAHLATYDRGGVLPPGLTLAYNGTGKDEYVSKGMGPVTVIAQFGTQTIEAMSARVIDHRLGELADAVHYAGGGGS